MNWYPIIKNYYDIGLYTSQQLDTFVLAGWITNDQKLEIINEKEKNI